MHKKVGIIKRIRDAYKFDARLRVLSIGLGIFFLISMAFFLQSISLPIGKGYYESFIISITASFLEDLVFFLLLGLSAILISINKPGDEDFHNRVKYFFNGSNATDGSRKHISEEMRKLGIFSPRYRAIVTISEINATESAMRATFQIDRTLVNMFKDQPFLGEEHDYFVSGDRIPGLEKQGELLTAYSGDERDKQYHIDTPIPIYDDPVRKTILIDIPANSEVSIGYRSWIWYKIGEDYEIKPTRYTERIEGEIVNKTGKAIRIRCGETQQELVLTPGNNHPYKFDAVASGSTRIPFTLLGVAK